MVLQNLNPPPFSRYAKGVMLPSIILMIAACGQDAPLNTKQQAVAKEVATNTISQDADETLPLTGGVNHLGLAVSNLDASAAFFIDILGWRAAGGDPDYPAKFVTDGKIFLTLWQVTDPATATPFNRKENVGLHHLALTVADLETLDKLHAVLKDDESVTIEFAPEFLGNGPTTHMMIREPSGLRLEFIVPGGKRRG